MAANTFTSRRHNESISTVTTENFTCSCTYVHAFIYLFVISFQGPIYKRAGPWSINLLIYFYSLSLLLSILQLKDKYFEVKTNPSRWRHVVNGVSKYVFGGGGSSIWIKYTQFHFLSRMYFLLPNILLTLYIYHMASRVTYQNISPEVTRKPWRVMSPDADAEGRGWHNAPGLSCHRGADILV